MNVSESRYIEKLVKLLYAAFAVLAVMFVLPRIVPCLLPFFFAWIIALIIKPFVSFFESLRVNKRIAVILSMLVVLGLLSAVLYFVSKAAVNEVRIFAGMLGNTKDGIPLFVWDVIDSLPKHIQKVVADFLENYDMSATELVMPAITTALPKLGGVAGKLPSVFVFTVVFLMAIYFFSYDEKGLRQELKKFISEKNIEHLRKARIVMGRAFGGYVKAQLIIMAVVFTILLTGFVILDVKLALLLAFIISLLDAIPVLGTGMILNPMAIIYLIQGDYVRAIGFVSLYVIILFVRNFLEPRVLSVQLGMHPIITLVSMYAGLKLIGVIGMIIGPVIALIVISFIKMNREGV